MKGLLLAGGHGTRLRPLTHTGNKHMLPIANKPMVLYGLEHLRNAGIREIGVVLGPIREGLQELIGDGSKFGVKVTYIEQDEPKGLAHAVLVSENFIRDEPFIMYLGDNLLKEGTARFRETFESKKADCVAGIASVANPSQFGSAQLKDGKLVKVTEKEAVPKGNLVLVGVYVFSPMIIDAAKKIRPSSRNELEISDAIQVLIDEGRSVETLMVKGWWKDTGKPEDLLEANQLVLSDIQENLQGEFSVDTRSTGTISIGNGSKTKSNVSLRGPIIIGENCSIGPNVYIGPYTSIGDDCALTNTEIENSIIMKDCHIQGAKRISDSLIGSYTTVTDSEDGVPRTRKLIIGERSFAQI